MLYLRRFVAHFHAFYDGQELVVGLSPVRILQGDAPERVRAMVLAWASAHRPELLEAWRRLGAALPPRPIEPLR
jgi:hypothetical protein